MRQLWLGYPLPRDMSATAVAKKRNVGSGVGLSHPGGRCFACMRILQVFGRHVDDERELGPCALIGSVSFGEARSFQMKHKFCDEKRKITLEHGSYLLMKGKTQQNWLHQIPKSKRPLGERINLTFRCIF